ncbi:hypothetical protein BDZ97DRAFT_1760291 [Flammula alnicola]|nr:hypothetical protein BDZ97DRAFT_1760291 [Flammula alnicola]
MAVLATPDWLHNMDNNRQRTSPANEGQGQGSHPQTPQQQQQHQQQQQQQLLHQQQQQQQMLLAQQQSGYPYPVQQQPQGSWTPNITAPPFYPSFYQNQQQQPPPQPYQTQQAPFFDPANAQLAAQWAYQQMMFNAQHGFPQHIPPSQRPPNPNQPGQPQGAPDYFSQAQLPPVFNPFPSGTPPPHANRPGEQQTQPYPGFHPYRRPNRQQSSPAEVANERRQGQGQGIGQIPHPPYARPDASGSSSSINSSSSQRQRTNSNQSAHSSGHNVPAPGHRGVSPAQSSPRGSPSPVASSSTPSPLRQPHIRSGSASSSTSTATATSIRPSPSLPTTATSTASASTNATVSASSSATPRLTRPSPLSQGTFTASEKRRSRDDIDLGAMHSESTPTATMIRSGGLKGRLRRALSFNAAQTLKEEADAEVAAEKAAAEGHDDDDDDDDVSIKASQVNGKLKANSSTPAIKVKSSMSGTEDEGPMSASTSAASMPVKKKGRAASLFNSRLNASTDNISLSSTVSSASVMIRKLGAMGKLARRNSLAGITSLFKDKDKSKDKDGAEGSGSSKGKKKEKDKKSAKGAASLASVSHVTAELDRPSATGDWSVGTDMNGLSPAAKLARQHTLKSNAEAAAKAKEAMEARDAAAAAAATSGGQRVNGVIVNGTQVPAWDHNTTTRQGSVSPVKGGSSGGVRINEDGTRTLIEDDDDESDDGHYHHHYQQHPHHGQQQRQQGFHADGWDDDEDWDQDGDGERDEEEDVTIRVGVDQRTSIDSGEDERYIYGQHNQLQVQHPADMEPWAVDLRRSVERTRRPAKGILKRAESYDQHAYLHDPANLPHRLRSNSYNNASTAHSELGPLARMPSPDPDHIDGLHRHGSHSSGHGPSTSTSSLPSQDTSPPLLPPLSFDSNSSPLASSFSASDTSKDLPDTPTTATSSTFTASTSFTSTVSSGTPVGSRNGGNIESTPAENRTSAIYQHPNLNSSAPALSTMGSATSNTPPTLTHRSATSPNKRLTFATNLSVYDTFSASVYDRRSEPATWSRLTPALAQRIKEELNSYKMEEMEVHASSRIHLSLSFWISHYPIHPTNLMIPLLLALLPKNTPILA